MSSPVAEADRLQGLRLLIVEDEAIIAMMLEDMLDDLGCAVVASLRSVAAALDGIKQMEFDGAILDVNLRGERADPIADALAARGVPFIFATGYGEVGISDRFKGVVVLQKPFESTLLRRALLRGVAER